MAKKQPAKKTTKTVAKNIKPEAIYVAKKRPAVTIKKPIKKKRQKAVRKHKPLLFRRLKRRTFYAIIYIFAIIACAVVYVYIATQVRQATAILNQAQSVTNSSSLKSVKQLGVARAVGSDKNLQSEMINVQSAPADLQSFVLKDYRLFKQRCVVNGQLLQPTSYTLTNVIYDNFAVVERDCNGSEMAILKKFDSGWGIVFSGNVLPPCSLVNDLAIPQGATLYCQQNAVRYVNANP